MRIVNALACSSLSTSLAAQPVPTSVPEDVGMSSERLLHHIALLLPQSPLLRADQVIE